MEKENLGAVILVLLLALSGSLACGASSDPPRASPATEDTSTERHVELEGQPNFRDLGGYVAADGRTVKWSQVYRSGQLPDLTDADMETLEILHLQTVVTFLLSQEIEKYGEDRLPAGVEELRLPITGELAEELSLQAGVAIRTGDFSALGVPWETVRQDYLLSNSYRAEEIDEQLERIRHAARTLTPSRLPDILPVHSQA